jgi:hypothetical protein
MGADKGYHGLRSTVDVVDGFLDVFTSYEMCNDLRDFEASLAHFDFPSKVSCCPLKNGPAKRRRPPQEGEGVY